jgi:hypothetical protein
VVDGDRTCILPYRAGGMRIDNNPSSMPVPNTLHPINTAQDLPNPALTAPVGVREYHEVVGRGASRALLGRRLGV